MRIAFLIVSTREIPDDHNTEIFCVQFIKRTMFKSQPQPPPQICYKMATFFL